MSDNQSGGAPFTLSGQQNTSRTDALPPILVRQQFSRPEATEIPQAFDDPVSAPRIIGQLDYPSPAVYQWSFSGQHRFSPSWSVNLDYLGSHTIHNSQFVVLNPGEQPLGPLADLDLQARRRLPGWGSVNSWVPWGWARYQSGTIGVKNRKWNGFTFMSNFIWAKNLTSSRSIISSDTGNRHYKFYDIWRGRSEFIPTARSVSAWSYELPLGRGRGHDLSGVANAVLGGWVVSGIGVLDGSSQKYHLLRQHRNRSCDHRKTYFFGLSPTGHRSRQPRFIPTARSVSAWSYELPLGRGRGHDLSGVANAVLGGWVVSGITEFSTGAPKSTTPDYPAPL